MNEEYEYTKSNREKRMTPKLGAWWCGSCDGELVPNGGKCPHCGNRENKKTVLKKETI